MDFKKLEALEKQVKNCKRCTLYASCKGKVFGDIGSNTKVIFIAEAPGSEEEMTGTTLIGPAGQLFRSWVKVIGLKDNEMSLLNIIRCQPPNNRAPLESEISSCSKWLNAQLDLISCNKIVLLGRTACNAIIPDLDGTVLKHVGKIYEIGHMKYLIMPHPSFVMRDGNRYPVPLDKLQKFIEGD